MSTALQTQLNPLNDIVLQKEKEWKEAFQLRVQSLEAILLEREEDLKNERLRFHKLKEDFEYNLKLIEERDEELEKYDAIFGKVKEAEHAKAAEISELLVRMDEVKLKFENETKAKEELQKHYQKRLQEYQSEMNNFRQVKDNEINQEREELVSHRRNLESQLREAEDDFEFRRQELVSEFDEVMRKREQEFRSKLDETSGLLLANDLKIRTLTKELEMVRSASGRCKEELEKTEVGKRELEKELKEKEWMITDLQNTHKFKIADMEAQIENQKSLQHKLQEDFQRKHGELDRLAREREEMLINAKQGFSEQERKLEYKIRELHSHLEAKDQEYRQKEWSLTDKLKEQEIAMQRLQESVAELQSKLDSQTEESARSTVAKDVELEALQQQQAKLRTDLAQRKDEVARLQRELTLSLEREASLDRSKSQLELDWQRRCEDAERTGYEKQEELVKSLSQSKEEALALVNHQKRDLSHKDGLIRILTAQRNESVATLKRHGLSVPTQIPTKETTASSSETQESLKVEELQAQNESLLQIIHQMRTDMEDLTSQLSQPTVVPDNRPAPEAPITADYVGSLEKEVRDLKARNRELGHALAEKEQEKANEPVSIVGKRNDPFVIGHVRELNDTIGCLRQQKLELTSQVRKWEAAVTHLQEKLNQRTEEVRQKQVTIDQLQYQLSTESRRSEEELASWRQRNSDLALQLTQARHEADEFYKSGLERNTDAVSLGHQLSVLKLDLANQGKTSSVYNPQTHLLQQLQEEIDVLRKKIRQGEISEKSADNLHPRKIGLLQIKLREAAGRISALVKEREQLIKMGNKLRAELMKAKGNKNSLLPAKEGGKEQPHKAHLLSAASNLQALEQLQYQLTARELQYAQQGLLRATEPRTTPYYERPTPKSPHSNSPMPLKPDIAPLLEEKQESKFEKDASPWQPSFSSEERSSLQEIWKLLDDESPGASPRRSSGNKEIGGPLKPSRHSGSSSTSDGFTIKGRPSNVLSKPGIDKPVLSTKAAGKWKPTAKNVKIRNYNIRDSHVST